MSYIEYAYALITWIGGGLLCVVGFILVQMAEEIIGRLFAGVLTLMGYWSLRIFGIRRSVESLDAICIFIGFIEFVAIIAAGVRLFGLGDVS